MPNDDQRLGLKVPEQHTSTVPHLRLVNSEGDMLNGKDLLNQMMDELQKVLASSDDSTSTAAEYATDMCMEMVRKVQAQVSKEELAPMSKGHFLLALGYLYGKLTMPDSRDYKELYRHYISDEERQIPLRKVEAERERGRQWIKNCARQVWEQDHAKELRIGEVVKRVLDTVRKEVKRQQNQGNEGPRRYWPSSAPKIRELIREVAPDYAVRPGRPSRK
ncbi:hypothetical protein [Halomonas smyrnensis]|uniref:hypothetical protein n=1 Tax=Halomonas smyrnensis TaxID=720605 RepID=UPI0012EACBA6|nr:hypothetical protein [Halomonas smyrnensis]